MDFQLSEEQIEVQNLARQILSDQCDNEQLRAFDDAPLRFNKKLWADLAEAGLLGVALDEQFGGMGFDFSTLCLFIEEVGRTAAPVPVVPVLVSAALALQKHGSEAAKKALLPAVASGEKLLTAALIEPGNEDPTTAYTLAVETSGQWQLNGEKTCVPMAEAADHILLSAHVDSGVAVFAVERNATGVVLEAQIPTAGENQYHLTLDNVSAKLVAEGEDAQNFLRDAQLYSMAAFCAQAVGVTDKMMRLTASYTSEREQFGVKIATFQAVGQRAADCYIDVECLRLVTQQAVYRLASGADASEEVMIAKIWAGDACHRVSHAAQHLHGGMGVDRDYELWRYCLWAKHIELSLGSSAELIEKLGDSLAEGFKSAV
jgi:alkylation response protein AidB-like acyl-CoA dehydrogenase